MEEQQLDRSPQVILYELLSQWSISRRVRFLCMFQDVRNYFQEDELPNFDLYFLEFVEKVIKG